MVALRYIRYALSIALTVFFLLHITSTLPIPFLDTLENLSYDSRVKMMLAPPDETQVVIIDIDEQSLDAIGHWPWNRDTLARLVDVLFEHYQVRAMGFDVVFAEANENEAAPILRQMATGPLKDNKAFLDEYDKALRMTQRDKRFAQSLQNRNTILGFVMDTDSRTGTLPESVATLDQPILDRIPFIEASGYTANLEVLQSAAASAGFFDNPLLDGDGIYRRMALLQQYEDRLHASLALALTRALLGSPQLELIVAPGADNDDELLLEWLKIGDLIIPVDQHAGILVPYIGKQRSFSYISAIDVLEKSVPFELIDGKIALLGSSAPGLYDLRATPLEAASPGVEIHASVIQGILDQSIMHRPGYTRALEFSLVLFLGLLLTLLLPLLSPLSGMIATTLLLLLLVAGNLYAWAEYQLVFPLTSPLLLVIAMYILHTTYGFVIENRNKRRLAHLFSQYVPPELVDEISKNMAHIHLDGEIRDMTVMFTDVRNFTRLSEQMAPQQITRLMNAFLTPITEVIHQHRGTIDKYMGDAVMAFWGAPLKDPRHALHATTAAMDIISRLNALKAEFAAKGWPEITIGIGINTGTMNVGNKGSAFRMNYTVLGDAVNLGSRLEHLTKVYGVEIIAGENTRREVPEIEFRELDRVRVKGRDRPVTIYEPLGPVDSIGAVERGRLQQYQQGLTCYRERDWNSAEREFQSLSEADPQCKIYRIYLDRIEQYRHNPPADNWDGNCHYE